MFEKILRSVAINSPTTFRHFCVNNLRLDLRQTLHQHPRLETKANSTKCSPFISRSFDYLLLIYDLRLGARSSLICGFVLLLSRRLQFIIFLSETMCRFTNTSAFFPRDLIEISTSASVSCLIKTTAGEIKVRRWLLGLCLGEQTSLELDVDRQRQLVSYALTSPS